MFSIDDFTTPLLLATIGSFICLIIYGVKRPFLKNASMRDLPSIEAEYTFVFFFVWVFFFIALSCLFYVVINLYMADYSMAGIQQQFSNGTFPMNITSLLLGISIVKSVYFIGRATPWPNKEQAKRYENYNIVEFKELEYLKAEKWSYDIEFLFLMQNFIYMINLFSLWIALVSGINNLWFLFLSYMLFYIVNDWNLMHHYTILLKGRLSHILDRKINVFNALLFTCGVMMFYSEWVFLLIYIFFNAAILVIRYLIKNNKLFIRRYVIK